MELRLADVWDLSLEAIEHLYRHRHMNTYVYAGLMLVHQSPMPLNRIVRLRKDRVPECLHDGAEKLLALSPYLGNDDARTVRVNATYHAFELLSMLEHVPLAQADRAIALLGALAYIPILAEKNDHLPLWMNPAVRARDPVTVAAFERLVPEMDLETFIRSPLWTNDTGVHDPELRDVPVLMLYYFVPRAVQSILVMIENGVDHAVAAEAFRNVERNMVRYERECDLGQSAELRRLGNTRHPSSLRYRNTLYLYGGNLLERMGRREEAFAWYTRDIYLTNLPDLFQFYLTSLKTCERLLCALRVAPEGVEDVLLRDLVERSMHAALRGASPHARSVRRYIAEHPEADLAAIRFFTNPERTRDLLYAGEAAREPFLASLIYNRIVHGVPYGDIDYRAVLAYGPA